MVMSSAIVWPALALVFCTWAVSLAGLASLQAECSAGSYLGVRGFSAGLLSCRKIYRYYWFIVAFEFLLIAGLAASLATGLYRRARMAWVGLFAIAALLYIQATDSFLTAESVNRYKSGSLEHRARTATAGFLMTVVANLFVLIALGVKPAGTAGAKRDPVVASAV